MEWIKLNTNGILRGSISVQLTEAERFVWIALLAKAGECRTRGVIAKAKGVPFKIEELAMDFGTTVELVQSTLDKCQIDNNDQDRHGNRLPRLIVDDDGCIHITNWEYYQAVPPGKQKNLETPTERRHREIANLLLYTKRYPQYAAKMLTDKGWEIRNGCVIDSATGEVIVKMAEVK